ncbi:MAG: hypothetical protein HQM16_17080 [Deltaproteobacteria bacterium]|nr:hypothetical protein [Deltaproteobacteria bacterium]
MNTKKSIYKPTGELLFSITDTGSREIVTDRIGTLLGYTENNNTYDKCGRRVAMGEAPSLLFGYLDNKNKKGW